MIKAILLAAGQSKRLKSENKLIKLYKKKPLINHPLNTLHKSKVNKVIVVLGHQHKEVKKIIKKNKKNIFIYNKDYKKGMASSIKVGLKKINLTQPPEQLSGGQQRRLAVAVQLLRNPSILLLDEPTAGLDYSMRNDVKNLILDLKNKNTIIIVTHEPALFEGIPSRILFLEKGKIKNFMKENHAG